MRKGVRVQGVPGKMQFVTATQSQFETDTHVSARNEPAILHLPNNGLCVFPSLRTRPSISMRVDELVLTVGHNIVLQLILNSTGGDCRQRMFWQNPVG